jgi:hypothetical protein
MKYARIVDNKVYELFTEPEGVNITDCFHPDLVKQFVACSDEVEPNWLYNGTTFSAPPAFKE